MKREIRSGNSSIDRVRYAAIRAVARLAGQPEPTIEEFQRADHRPRDLFTTWNVILRNRSRADPKWRVHRKIKRAAVVSLGLVLSGGLLAWRLSAGPSPEGGQVTQQTQPSFQPFAPIEGQWHRSR